MATGFEYRPFYAPSVPTLGNKPSDSDVNYFKTLSAAVESMMLGKRNPQWNDELELQEARSLSFTTPLTGLQGSINDRTAHRFPLADINQPRDPMAVLQTAFRYAYESPFVAKMARVKSEFTWSALDHRTKNSTVKDFYTRQVINLSLNLRVLEILWYMYAIGIVPIWWGGEESRAVEFIEILDPRMCHVEYNYGKARLFLKIDARMENAVRDPDGKLDIRNRLRYEAMPNYWKEQILHGYVTFNDATPLSGKGTYIELMPGSYAVVENRFSRLSRSMGGLDGLPTQPAFEALQRYRLLSAGDYAAAWNLKNMITLISEGDPKAEGKDWKPATTERLTMLQGLFQKPDSNYTVYCDPTTNIRFMVPPVEKIFGTQKFQQTEKEIKEILGLPSYMWISEQGSNYSNAVNETKLLKQECSMVWMILTEQFFRPLYARLRQSAARPGFKDSEIVYPRFNSLPLEDSVTFLKDRADLYSRGALSVQSLQELAGLDPEWELAQQKESHSKYGDPSSKDMSIYSPLWEPSQGKMSPMRDKGGNPDESQDGNQDAQSVPRSPRAKGD